MNDHTKLKNTYVRASPKSLFPPQQWVFVRNKTNNIIQLKPNSKTSCHISSVSWTGDHTKYDLQLFQISSFLRIFTHLAILCSNRAQGPEGGCHRYRYTPSFKTCVVDCFSMWVVLQRINTTSIGKAFFYWFILLSLSILYRYIYCAIWYFNIQYINIIFTFYYKIMYLWEEEIRIRN